MTDPEITDRAPQTPTTDAHADRPPREVTDSSPAADAPAPVIGPVAVRSTGRVECVASVLPDEDIPGSGWVPAGADRTIVATTLRCAWVRRREGKAWELDGIAVTGNRLRRTGVPGTTTDTVRTDVLADLPDWVQTWVRAQRPSNPVTVRGGERLSHGGEQA